MRAVVQRVSSASVTVDGELVGAIGFGLCVLVGVAQGDGAADVESVAEKVVGLRVFEDESAYPVEKLNAPTQVASAVNSMWKGSMLVTPRPALRAAAVKLSGVKITQCRGQ